eukprot:TRINITY_DN90878_c0_g1_i1.p1 TRINITY_DN90878_c0_g1~~TRINITY_DN90878_c0_g1_i1.p1  ORF type:complete len:408 (+),score=68.26 TRINITY_DN90878_c0_g1_i1:88-1311(+)
MAAAAQLLRVLLYYSCIYPLLGSCDEHTDPINYPCLHPGGDVRGEITYFCHLACLEAGGSFRLTGVEKGTPLTAEYVKQMAVLQRTHAHASGTPQSAQQLAEKGYLTKSPVIVYAITEGKLIGSALYKKPIRASKDGVSCSIGEAGGLVVDEKYQKDGVAVVMTRTLSDLVYYLGYNAIYTETKVSNYKSLMTQLVPYKENNARDTVLHYLPSFSVNKIARNLLAAFAGLSTIVGYVKTKQDLPKVEDTGDKVYQGTIFALLVSPAGMTGAASALKMHWLSNDVLEVCCYAGWHDMTKSNEENYEPNLPFTAEDLKQQFADEKFRSYKKKNDEAEADIGKRLPLLESAPTGEYEVITLDVTAEGKEDVRKSSDLSAEGTATELYEEVKKWHDEHERYEPAAAAGEER